MVFVAIWGRFLCQGIFTPHLLHTFLLPTFIPRAWTAKRLEWKRLPAARFPDEVPLGLLQFFGQEEEQEEEDVFRCVLRRLEQGPFQKNGSSMVLYSMMVFMR